MTEDRYRAGKRLWSEADDAELRRIYPDLPTVQPLHAADVLALLEEKPYHEFELVACLDLHADIVRATLKALKRAGQVKRVGEQQKWCLAGYIAPLGRVPQIDRAVCRSAILLALEAGPLAMTTLMVRTRYSRNVLKAECAALLKAAAIQRLGGGRASTWALPNVPLPTASGLKTATPRATSPPRQVLRQPQERPATQTVKRADTLSWFCTAPQAGFTQLASHHERRMRESKEARSLPLRMLP